jgi:hypothetical protein
MGIAEVSRTADLAAGQAVSFAGLTPRSAQVLLVAVAGAALAAGLAFNSGSEHAVAQAGPDLTRLLRAMAAMKAMMAVGAIAVVLWRLQSPVLAGRFSLYAAATAGMAAGPGLIWTMAHVASGAFLLHAGLIASVLLLWRDPEVSRRLELLVARKRAALRS